MKIVLARLQTALALATANGDANATTLFTTAITEITPFAKDPYILPDVLTPPAPVPDVASMTIAEAHDAVQAGVITRQDAVDAGVVATVDALPPHPSEVPAPPATPDPTTSAPAAVADAPASSVPDPAAPSAPAVDPAPVAAAPVPDSQSAAPIVSAPADAPVTTADTIAGLALQAEQGNAPSPPPPVDRLTALEQRVTADEAREQQFESDVKSGKVSRQ